MTPQLLRGLTLTHPWAWCIAHAGKDVENRSWRPERQGGQIGMFLAIHGGALPGPKTGKREEARMDLAAALRVAGRTALVGVPALQQLDMGQPATGEERFMSPGIVALARLAGVATDSTSPWAAAGQQHWQLADVLALPEPIPHRGAQGLWTVEPDVLEQLRAAWKKRAA